MDRYCKICRNTTCINHGKYIVLAGEGWQCDYIPVPTNADRIRAMTDEELSEDYCEFLESMLKKIGVEFDFDMDKAKSIMLKYLQQPAEVD